MFSAKGTYYKEVRVNSSKPGNIKSLKYSGKLYQALQRCRSKINTMTRKWWLPHAHRCP